MKKLNYDIIIVGAGISGAVLAERCANELNKKVLIIEKRNHIAGNCYDYFNEEGILVPKYGPHFFHTNYEDVWKYISKFTEWLPYEHRVLSYVDSKMVPIPVNIETVNRLINSNIKTEEEMIRWLAETTKKINHPKNSEELALARVGKVLYEKMFKNYTKKQWDMWPSKLDASVINRIPVRTNFDDRYYTDQYQAMPKVGYTKLFERILNNPNIEIRLNTDYFDIKNELEDCKKLFFTGPVDKFFKYKEGELQYRSLRFECETWDKEYYQETAQINYPNDFEYTRITEPKHATGQKHKKTTIIKEYPIWGSDPYYPVLSKKNQKIYTKYKTEAKKLEKRGIYFIGRLASYKYINMDQAFKNSLDLFNKFFNE